MKFITKISKYIDHTLLKPSATKKEIKNLCQEAIKYEFISVCVNPIHVSFCSKILSKSNIKICTVVGFPLGASKLNQKCSETSTAVNDGAEEIDMVMNIGSFKDGNYEYVLSEIQSVVLSAENKIVKVIIETGLLNKDEIIKACNIVNDSDAHFIKTSTGFINGGNASIENVELIKQNISSKKKIKASGGIKTLLQLRDMLDIGADRIGTSSGVQIMKEIESNNC
jgi:deoxyribose-phosphate aldolase